MKNAWRYPALLIALSLPGLAIADDDDWPTKGHDARRSGVTRMQLSLPLQIAWQHIPAHGPSPAWPKPARSDYWHNKHDLQPRVAYDRAFDAAVANHVLIYGSSTEDHVVCLDTRSGKTLWTFWTEGPVRLAPTIVDDRVYVGSDDGWLYCLSRHNGHLRWRYRAGRADSRCPGNGRMISRWPIRSSVVVEKGVAYCAAGLFPTSEEAYLCAVNADTGRELYRRSISQPAQGYMLSLGDQLLIPSGRASPGLFARADGQPSGTIVSPGGSYAVAAGDAVAAGTGDGTGQLALSDSASRQNLFSFDGRHLIAHGKHYFIHRNDLLAALDSHAFLPLAQRRVDVKKHLDKLRREKKPDLRTQLDTFEKELVQLTESMKACWKWKTSCNESHALILVGDHLFAGGEGRVAAYGATDGRRLWSADVEGRVCSLAAADSALFVSTDSGAIHCFRSGQREDLTRAESPDPPTHEARKAAGDLYQDAASTVLKLSGADQGYCLVWGAEDGRLAYEIASQSRLRVIGVEADAAQVQRAREFLSERGVYGTRVVIHQLADEPLPYPAFFANLIVSRRLLTGSLPDNPAELFRLLRPSGGVLCLGQPPAAASGPLQQWLKDHTPQGMDSGLVDGAGRWAFVRRGVLPGSGEWTHGLADPGNTACSMDQQIEGPLRIQWHGRPGPGPMTDRHHRNVTPLYRDGRLFIPGDNLLLAADAYNGTPLWEREFPRSRRLGAFLDCSNMVVGEQALYFAAQGTCHVLDPGTGKTRRSLTLPDSLVRRPRHWGYLAKTEGLLIGTTGKPQAAYYKQSREADLKLWYDNMSLVTGDRIFAMDPESGELRWSLSPGLVIHTTITIGGGRIYFVVSRSAKALANPLGRMPMADLVNGPNLLIALDLQTGKDVWRQPVDLSDCRHIVYLNYAQEKLVLSGNRYVDRHLWYFFAGMDAAQGETLWKASHNSGYRVGGDHGEQNRHPTIVGDTIYTYPQAYKLHTGERLDDWLFSRKGHGCGNISASARSIFWRGNNPWRRDLDTGSTPQRINSVTRLGCWINVIPAGGLVLIPEASSGCTCAYPLQTSLAYAPAHWLEDKQLPASPPPTQN